MYLQEREGGVCVEEKRPEFVVISRPAQRATTLCPDAQHLRQPRHQDASARGVPLLEAVRIPSLPFAWNYM